MKCEECRHYDECFFSGDVCRSYQEKAQNINREKLYRTGEDGFYELPRIPFVVIDF